MSVCVSYVIPTSLQLPTIPQPFNSFAFSLIQHTSFMAIFSPSCCFPPFFSVLLLQRILIEENYLDLAGNGLM